MVNEGDALPSDGIVQEGEAFLDESMLTGESEPRFRAKGEEVIGSTIVISGSLKVQITRIGTETVLSNMIELVKKAQREKPSIQKLADRISHVFVPSVLAIALITFLVSFIFTDLGLTRSLINSIAVLVVSCPCAMGLATPTAVAAGVGQLSRSGILVKSGQVLQNLASVRKVLFDKTGTLTEGKVGIVDFRVNGIDMDEAKYVFYEMEKHSSHPIAKAVVKAFGKTDFAADKTLITDVKELKSTGLLASDATGNTWKIKGVNPKPGEESNIIGLYKNEELVAWMEILDNIRTDAVKSIEQLKNHGLDIEILSGDSEKTVEKVAKTLGINAYHGQMKPEQKYKRIENENETGHVAMVGDGINDAAALNKATVGISFSDASRIAINSADMVLMNADLGLLPKAFKISKATMATIRQNLFWAFSYNIIAIPLAATGLLNPMVAALMMSFSDLMVVGNSIRLVFRRFS